MFHKTQAQAPNKEQTTEGGNNTQTVKTGSETGWSTNGTANTNKEGTQPMAQKQEKTTEDQTQTTTENTQTPNTQPFGAARTTFGGSRYANNFGATNTTPGTATTTAGRQLVIGQGISMSGEIGACEHLVVEGHVEAALKGAKVLDISETGSFSGSVEIEEATVAGEFDGSITVSGRLTVKSTGEIKGTIAYGELAVEAGANLEGKLGPVKEKKTTTSETKKSDSKTTTKTTSTKSQDNKSGSELPFASNAAE